MTEAIVIAVLGVIGVLVSALLSFHAGRAVSKSQSFALDTDTLIKLSNKVQELSQQVIDLKNEVDDVKDKNRVLWAYTYQLLDQLRKHKIKPVVPPEELMDDPKLATLLKWINE